MKLLLIGSTGMLGCQLKKHFANKGYQVFCPDKSILDVSDFSSIKAYEKQSDFHYLVNASAYTQVDLAEKEKEKAYSVNSLGVKHLIWLANKKKAKFIHFSTDYVFDGQKQQSYKENDNPTPLNIYGSSKWQGEQHVIHTCHHYLIVRLSWLIGHYGKNFISTMTALMKREQQLRVVNDQWGRPTFCEDVAALFPQAFHLSGLYHFANREATTWYRLASYLHELLLLQSPNEVITKKLLPVLSIDYPTSAKRPLKAILNTQKIEQDLPCSPQSWKEALKTFLNLKPALYL